MPHSFRYPEFQRARNTIRNGFYSITPHARYLKLLWDRDKNTQRISEGYITRREILQDLYISLQEDLGRKAGSYRKLEEEFDSLYNSWTPEFVDYLVTMMVLQPVQNFLECEELADKHLLGIIKVSLIKKT